MYAFDLEICLSANRGEWHAHRLRLQSFGLGSCCPSTRVSESVPDSAVAVATSAVAVDNSERGGGGDKFGTRRCPVWRWQIRNAAVAVTNLERGGAPFGGGEFGTRRLVEECDATWRSSTRRHSTTHTGVANSERGGWSRSVTHTDRCSAHFFCSQAFVARRPEVSWCPREEKPVGRCRTSVRRCSFLRIASMLPRAEAISRLSYSRHCRPLQPWLLVSTPTNGPVCVAETRWRCSMYTAPSPLGPTLVF